MSHPNVAGLRRGYDAFEKADVDTVRSLLADDVVFHVGGRSTLAGDYKGHDEVFDLVVRLIDASEGTHHVVVRHVVADDHVGVVLATHEMRREDGLHRFDAVHVWDLCGGKARRVAMYAADPYALDEYLGLAAVAG